MGKSGISKGGQRIIILDTHCVMPQTYMNLHKLYARLRGLNTMGHIEFKRRIDTAKTMIEGESCETKKSIHVSPNSRRTMIFSSNQVMDYTNKESFGFTMTCKMDQLPRGVLDKNIFIRRRKRSTQISKVVRFFTQWWL